MAITKPQEFFLSIKNCKSISEVLSKTKAEKQYLENEYNTVASLKNGYTIYRNYLKTNIPETKKLSRKPLLDFVLKELRLNSNQQADFNHNKVINIKEDKSNLKAIFNVQNYVNTAKNLLYATSYIDNILGLCALTGRRVAEIGCTASFEYISPDIMLFTGQLKLKDNKSIPYEIPVLYNANAIISCLASIRERKPQFINNPVLFHNISKELSIRVKKHFTSLFEDKPKVKDLRAIYALLSYNLFNKNKKIDRDVYFSRILGHSKDDTTTCASYVDFYIY